MPGRGVALLMTASPFNTTLALVLWQQGEAPRCWSDSGTAHSSKGDLHSKAGTALRIPITSPLLPGCPWDRHAPAWLLEPGWSPALPGGGHWRKTDEIDI